MPVAAARDAPVRSSYLTGRTAPPLYRDIKQGGRDCMPIIYDRPPITEAICEIRLPEKAQWDEATPGLLWDRMKERYTKRKSRMLVPAGRILVAGGNVHQEVSVARGLQLTSADGKGHALVVDRLVSVHMLAPYQGWDSFRPDIERAHRALSDVVGPEPGIYSVVTVRYINRFVPSELNEDSVRLSDFFNFYPHVGAGLPQDYCSFQCSVELLCKDSGLRCIMTIAPIAPKPDVAPDIILDIACRNAPETDVAFADALEFIDAAHIQVRQVFEAAITKKTFELLGGHETA